MLLTRTAETDPRARRRLFAELQLGPRYSADPTPLASVLNLDHAVQQARRWQVCSPESLPPADAAR